MEQTESELLALRREKLAALEKLGVAPFGAAFETSGDIAGVREKFSEGAGFRIAGRISAHRDMGRSHFVDLKDASGRMQIYLQAKELGSEAMEVFKLLDLGDFIGVEGTCFTTKTGEPTWKVRNLELLAKSLRPLPEKCHC
jgi:lysyl-tRNA synthetase class 2